MSCIAGVGGGVEPLVRKARTAGTIVGIDGCALRCVRRCLQREGLDCDVHYDLSALGVKKTYHADFDRSQAVRLTEHIREDLARSLGPWPEGMA